MRAVFALIKRVTKDLVRIVLEVVASRVSPGRQVGVASRGSLGRQVGADWLVVADLLEGVALAPVVALAVYPLWGLLSQMARE